MNLLIPPEMTPAISGPPPVGMLVKAGGETMGTEWTVSAILPHGIGKADIARAALPVFDAIIGTLSPWEPDSFISRFNRAAPGTVLPAPRDFLSVFDTSIALARQSGGAFNPLYRCEPNGPIVFERLMALRDEEGQLVQPGGVMLDLSAAAKGLAVDRLARVVEALGVTSFLAEIGGEFTGRGVKPDGTPWWVDLEPPTARSSRWRIALASGAVATSGLYHKAGHLRMDDEAGKTGRPLASVSVLASTCMLADGWATALYASGSRHAVMAGQNSIAAVFQYVDGTAACSEALKPYLD